MKVYILPILILPTAGGGRPPIIIPPEQGD